MSTIAAVKREALPAIRQDKAAAQTKPAAANAVNLAAGRFLNIALSPQALFSQSGSAGLALPDGLSKSLAEDQRKAADTIAAFDQAKKSLIADRKGAAQQKLEQAREKLKMLRMLGGDPKTVARQAKQIAQEIQAAAKEYGAALKAEGGSEAGISAVASPAAVGSEGVAADPGAAVAVAAQSLVPGSVSADAKAVEGDEASAIAANATTAQQQVEQAGGQAPASEIARQKTAAAYQDAAAKSAASSDRARGERETLDTFKNAAREAKRLIEEAANKLKAKNAGDPDAVEAERAASGMDKEIQALGETVQDVTGGGTASTSVAEPAPVLNILV